MADSADRPTETWERDEGAVAWVYGSILTLKLARLNPGPRRRVNFSDGPGSGSDACALTGIALADPALRVSGTTA